jgi:hypothetical protein
LTYAPKDKTRKTLATKEIDGCSGTTLSAGCWSAFSSSFFGVGIFVGIDESQESTAILVILALAGGLILVNKY